MSSTNRQRPPMRMSVTSILPKNKNLISAGYGSNELVWSSTVHEQPSWKRNPAIFFQMETNHGRKGHAWSSSPFLSYLLCWTPIYFSSVQRDSHGHHVERGAPNETGTLCNWYWRLFPYRYPGSRSTVELAPHARRNGRFMLLCYECRLAVLPTSAKFVSVAAPSKVFNPYDW